MLYITQLIYVKPGQEATFNEFESHAIPQIKKYGGNLLLRIKPNKASVIELSAELPYEIHLVQFESEENFSAYMSDKERNKFLHLKAQSVRASVVIKGVKI